MISLRRFLVVIGLAGWSVLGIAGPLLAADSKQDSLPLFTPALDLGIWTVVVFVILILLLRKYAWGPMLEGLQKREHNIQSALDEARKAREDARKLQEHLQREMDKAGEKVREILDEARRDAAHTTEDMVSKARAEIQAERDRLRREISTAQDQALSEIWRQSAELATMISSKSLRRQLNPEDQRRLVDESLAELQALGLGGNGR